MQTLTIEDVYRAESRIIAVTDRGVSSSDCWEWKGSKHPQGYGLIGIGTKKYYAHRLVMMIRLGRLIERREHVCHKCDNTGCVNPSHLFIGDAKANIADMDRKGRRRPPVGETSGHSVLTDAKVIQARQYYLNNDVSVKDVGEKFNLSTMAMYYALIGETWKHITQWASEARLKAQQRDRKKRCR